jgi:hypothetical protein
MSARHGLPSAQQRRIVRQMLGEMANRLEVNRPDKPFNAVSRIAVIQATTMDPSLGRALRDLAPVVIGETTRRAYAAELRKVLGGGAT